MASIKNAIQFNSYKFDDQSINQSNQRYLKKVEHNILHYQETFAPILKQR